MYPQFINKAQITKSAILVISFICFKEKVANVSAAFSNIWHILTEKWFRDYSKQLGVFKVHQQMYTMIAVTHKKESQLTCEASLNMSICPLWICMLESSLPNSLNKNHAVNLHRKNTFMYNLPSPVKNVLIKNCIVVSFYLICFCWMHWDDEFETNWG